MSNSAEVVYVKRPRHAAFRNWRNRFDAKASYVWRRSMLYDGVQVEPGDDVDSAKLGRAKLRRFWDAGVIDLHPDSMIHKKSTEQMIAETLAAQEAEQPVDPDKVDPDKDDEDEETDDASGGEVV